MRDAPPIGVDASVWRVLREAHADCALVTVTLGGDPAREITGCPVRFALGFDGRVRVALAVAEGTEQHVVVARITHAAALGVLGLRCAEELTG